MAIKTGDFVELDLVGKISSNDHVFDSTLEKKQPVVICVGKGMIFPKIDKALEGMDVGDELNLELAAEESFGTRKSELVQLTSINVFKQQNINPIPGLQLNIDGMIATVRSVSGGRVTIDFNHPLAGKNLKFWIKIRKLVTDVKDKIVAVCLDWRPNVKANDKGYEVEIAVKLPDKIAELKAKQIKELIPELKDKEIKFTAVDMGKSHEHEHQE